MPFDKSEKPKAEEVKPVEAFPMPAVHRRPVDFTPGEIQAAMRRQMDFYTHAIRLMSQCDCTMDRASLIMGERRARQVLMSKE